METQNSHENKLDFMSIFRDIAYDDLSKGDKIMNTHYDSFIALCHNFSENGMTPTNISVGEEDENMAITVKYSDSQGNSNITFLSKGEDYLNDEEENVNE